MLKTFALKKVLQWIAKIDWKRFLQFVGLVREAIDLYPKGAQITADMEKVINQNRASFVSTEIARILGAGNSGSIIITVLRELAVWYFRKTSP